MDAQLTLEPLPDQLPEPVSFSPERAATAALDSIGVIPSEVASRVTIAPPPSWVVERSLVADALAPTATNAWLLVDHQHHAEQRQYFKRIVRRLDTINAVQEAGQWRIDFDPRSDRLIIHSLAVVRGSQRGENARMERLRLLQREAGLESLVIRGLLTVVALLEDVRVGDTLDLSYTIESRPLIFPGHYWRWIIIPEPMPLRAFYLSVRFDPARSLRWKSNDPNLKPVILEEKGEKEWFWQTGAKPTAEVEANVPEWNSLGRWVQLTDFASWEDVAAGFTTAWQEDLENPELVRLAESIATSATTTSQRAERALTFLQDHLRYLSVSGDLGGQVPTGPAIVFSRGFGDCKDKAFAAAHLLRRLGVPARPVIVHTDLRQHVAGLLPNPGAFNHAIVEYDLDGKRRWVDVTVAFQGGTALSRPGAEFQLGLPIGPGVKDLEAIALEANSDRMELRETYLVDTSGRTSSLRVVLTATGREAERWRRRMAGEGPEAFARWREESYQQVFPHAQRAGKLEWDDDRGNNEFVVGEVFDLHEFDTETYDRRGVQFRFSAHTIQSVLGFQQRGKRRSPWALPFPCRIKHIIEIDSPSLGMPNGKPVRIDSTAFRFASLWQGHQGVTTITFTLQILEEAVPAADFDDFKKDVLEVWRHTRILGNLPPGSSVPWKKRAPEKVLPPRRNPPPPPPEAPDPTAYCGSLLPPIAPACVSPDGNSPVAAGATRSRAEKPNPVLPPSETRRRQELQRPNPVLSDPEEMVAASTSRRRARRRARRAQRRRLLIGAAILFGVLLLATALFFLLHRR